MACSEASKHQGWTKAKSCGQAHSVSAALSKLIIATLDGFPVVDDDSRGAGSAARPPARALGHFWAARRRTSACASHQAACVSRAAAHRARRGTRRRDRRRGAARGRPHARPQPADTRRHSAHSAPPLMAGAGGAGNSPDNEEYQTCFDLMKNNAIGGQEARTQGERACPNCWTVCGNQASRHTVSATH